MTSHAPNPVHSVAHSISGSVFVETFEQVPEATPVLAMTQDLHVPEQPLSQQTPS